MSSFNTDIVPDRTSIPGGNSRSKSSNRYMAPETLRPTKDGRQKLSKRVDVWSLGVVLFEMLHQGKTPFDQYRARGNIGAALAIASEPVHQVVMKFQRARVWGLERDLVRRHAATRGVQPARADLVLGLVRMELLFRLCECCLSFEALNRVDASDLRQWVESVLAQVTFFPPIYSKIFT